MFGTSVFETQDNLQLFRSTVNVRSSCGQGVVLQLKTGLEVRGLNNLVPFGKGEGRRGRGEEGREGGRRRGEGKGKDRERKG